MHRLYQWLVERSFLYRYLVPSQRGRGRLLKLLRRFEPADLHPGVVTRDGLQWYIGDLGSNADEAVYYGIPYDPETARLIDRSVQPGDFVVDVGANTGVFTSRLAHHVGPQGRVFAFEASPIFYQNVRRNIDLQHLTQVQLHQLALSDKESVSLHYTTQSSGSLVSDFTEFGMELRHTSQVQTKRLDDVLTADQIPRVRFIKIDVDGNEIDVLRGCEQVLRQSRPRLLVEVSDRAQQLAGASAKALLQTIADFGYWFQIADDRPTSDVETTLARVISQPIFCDVLCIHETEIKARASQATAVAPCRGDN